MTTLLPRTDSKTMVFIVPSVCVGQSFVENSPPCFSPNMVYRTRPFGLRVSRSQPQNVPSEAKSIFQPFIKGKVSRIEEDELGVVSYYAKPRWLKIRKSIIEFPVPYEIGA